MKFCTILLLTAALLCAQAPTPAHIARQALDFLLAGKMAELQALFNAEMKQKLTMEVLEKQVKPSVAGLGEAKKIAEPQTRIAGPYSVVTIAGDFANANITFEVAVDAEGKLVGMFMRPRQGEAASWKRPPYVKPDSFRERQVTVGAKDWPLPGTLTLPAGDGKFPAVVLVHGSGPNDRDESIGPNKPFRDLAEGLASRGIAVLRYEKRTRQHAPKLALAKEITLDGETVDDAVAAADFLRTQPDVDAKRIYVLGHSLGAYAAPRIAAADGHLAGIAILAGFTRPLEDLVLEQMTYLASLYPENADMQKRLEAVKADVAALKKMEKPVEGAMVLGMPASYLIGLRQYDPAGEARKLSIPILVLHGERDHQVTMEDFAGWKKALGDRNTATLKSYPSLNHLFMEGQGKSTPAEYQKEGHVASEAVADIASWITAK
ncbi:MAG: alpha/beta fold hydrolase [Bryobacteraceae bacterium]|nr:alpha/beta fold hydrolase [Bryobacteraceae bacterium]